MKPCIHCATQNLDDARFCASCGLVFTDEPTGTPASGTVHPAEVPVLVTAPRKPVNNAVIVISLVALALASAGLTLLLTRADDPKASSSATTITVASASSTTARTADVTTTQPTTTAATTAPGAAVPAATLAAATTPAPTTGAVTPVPTGTPTTTPPPATLPPTTTRPAPPDPQTQLNDTLDNDRAVVEGLVGFWVPQLSSKKEGTVADGITYSLADVVAKDQELRDGFGAVLLFSGEYNYKVTDLYIDIVPQGFGDPDSALGFCTSNGIDRDNCFAKFITHDMSLTSTTKLQP